MKTRWIYLLYGSLLALLLTGCYRPAPEPTPSLPLPTATPLPPTAADVRADGSALVGVVTEGVAAGFSTLHPRYTVAVETSGTSSGFDRMCQGESDLVNALRQIDGDEASACTRNGVDWLEIVIGYDVLVVVANPGDAFLSCLTVDELRAVWGGDAADTPPGDWSVVREAFPDLPLTVVTAADLHPSQDRFFMDAIGVTDVRTDTTPASGDDTAVLVLQTPGAIGYLNYGRYREAEEAGAARAVAVDAGTGCTLPDPDVVWRGIYRVLVRPLYLYVNVASLRRLPMSLFVIYYLSPEGQVRVAEAGYLPASPESYEQARAAVDTYAGE